jgi:hypothetical protein
MCRLCGGRRAVTQAGTACTGDSERGTLDKAADENFPVAPFFLPRAWREDLMAVYGFARLVDDIGDGDLAPGGADARFLGVSTRHPVTPSCAACSGRSGAPASPPSRSSA